MKYDELMVLFHKIGELKRMKRSGWLRHEIQEPESVADHSFRTAFMAMIVGDLMDVNTEKLVKMALIHDLAEVVAGDITPHDGITREDKRKREEEGLRQLLKGVPNGNSYIDLWMEYEEQKSQEARLLRNIDKLEMAIQAAEYQRLYPEKDLSEFISEAKSHIDIHEVGTLLKEIKNPESTTAR
ncbi:MAG: HD domain-containing protein [Thermoplasmata archaeon]